MVRVLEVKKFIAVGRLVEHCVVALVDYCVNKVADRSCFSSARVANVGDDNDLSAEPLTPLNGLSPYFTRWVSKVRVTAKTGIKTFRSGRGLGRMFSANIVDSAATEMQLVAFDSAARRLQPCDDDPAIPGPVATGGTEPVDEEPRSRLAARTRSVEPAVPLSSIAGCREGALVSVIGVVVRIGEAGAYRRSPMQELAIADSSGAVASVTLWGEELVDAARGLTVDRVVALQRCRVKILRGSRVLYASGDASALAVDPNTDEALRLRAWFDRHGYADAALLPQGHSFLCSPEPTGSIEGERTTLADAELRGLDEFDCVCSVVCISDTPREDGATLVATVADHTGSVMAEVAGSAVECLAGVGCSALQCMCAQQRATVLRHSPARVCAMHFVRAKWGWKPCLVITRCQEVNFAARANELALLIDN
eukprot:m51a1_g13892 putative replication protein a 70 kda dna-binding subunit-like (424) ;mRNA; r:678303-680204